jgi:hypothetical protein
MEEPQHQRESGQAAVESAIILPLFVFLLLGTLQLGLMHQARLMTKYAAYKAVRAGALHNAKNDIMQRSALAVLLPLLSEGRGGGEFIQSVTSASDFLRKWKTPAITLNMMQEAPLPYVEVTTCGPLRQDASSPTGEVDFDNPDLAASTDWRGSQRTKLRIQVTLNYRMPIPFANWVIHSIAMNRELPMLMRMGKPDLRPPVLDSRYWAAASLGTYVLPIRAAYTMRMQSNVYLSQLPETNLCLTTNKYN